MTGRNIILAGNAGTGKTYRLGIKACMKGYKVCLTTIPLLINQIRKYRF
ncbi:ATP-binding protein [Bacillus cereus group sp. N6]|nr:ATP-binding protein [Bacillus cereus group sp. N6]